MVQPVVGAAAFVPPSLPSELTEPGISPDSLDSSVKEMQRVFELFIFEGLVSVPVWFAGIFFSEHSSAFINWGLSPTLVICVRCGALAGVFAARHAFGPTRNVESAGRILIWMCPLISFVLAVWYGFSIYVLWPLDYSDVFIWSFVWNFILNVALLLMSLPELFQPTAALQQEQHQFGPRAAPHDWETLVRKRDADALTLRTLVFRANEPLSSGDADGSSCPVCLLAYEEGDLVKQLRCRHHFHEDCIDRWFVHGGINKTAMPRCPMRCVDVLHLKAGPRASAGTRAATIGAALASAHSATGAHGMQHLTSQSSSFGATVIGAAAGTPGSAPVSDIRVLQNQQAARLDRTERADGVSVTV